MAVVLYRGEESVRVRPKSVNGFIAQGWSKEKGGKVVEPNVERAEDDSELEAARQLYQEKFGKAPHGRMKIETLMEKLQEYTSDEQD